MSLSFSETPKTGFVALRPNNSAYKTAQMHMLICAIVVYIAIFMSCLISNVIQAFVRAATCDFKKCGILTCVDSDEPLHSPFKLGNSK